MHEEKAKSSFTQVENMRQTLIQNARYLGKTVDLLVNNGQIEAIGSAGEMYPACADRYDAADCILFPSFIDAHTHLRQPGFEWKEDIASGLNAAIHGGFGAVMCMANTDPVNDCAAVTAEILEAGKKAFPDGPRVYPIGATTVGLKGTELSRMQELAEAGCVALSNDGVPVLSSEIMRRVMEYAADMNLIVIDHCEDYHLGQKCQMNEGTTSGKLGLKGQPDVGETIQVARDVLLAEYLHLPIHIAHVSSARTVDLLAWSKGRGVDVTAETCPYYLLLDDTAVGRYNTQAKIYPPLRTQKDIVALRKAVKSGLIDMLVTDHAPHAAHEKEVPFDDAPTGFTGLDLGVTLTYSLVREGILSESDMIRLWCTAPAKRFKLPFNQFLHGDPADFFLFDPNLEWQVTPENLYSKSHNTPWLGQTVKGRVVAHWLKGKQIF